MEKKKEKGIDMMSFLIDEKKRNSLIKRELGKGKIHPKYGTIPDNKGMAFYLIENIGSHIPSEKIKEVADMFGYNYKQLQCNYDVMAEIETLFEGLD